MSEPKAFASLSPTLLARKGAAKPAMRPQLQPLQQFHEDAARLEQDDLGWNDLGEDHDPAQSASGERLGQVVAITPDAASRPSVLRQRDRLARQIEKQGMRRRSALGEGRRAAFTLRLDAERHLRLRLASTMLNQSAQQIVTEALDGFLASMPELETLARKIAARQRKDPQGEKQ